MGRRWDKPVSDLARRQRLEELKLQLHKDRQEASADLARFYEKSVDDLMQSASSFIVHPDTSALGLSERQMRSIEFWQPALEMQLKNYDWRKVILKDLLPVLQQHRLANADPVSGGMFILLRHVRYAAFDMTGTSRRVVNVTKSYGTIVWDILQQARLLSSTYVNEDARQVILEFMVGEETAAILRRSKRIKAQNLRFDEAIGARRVEEDGMVWEEPDPETPSWAFPRGQRPYDSSAPQELCQGRFLPPPNFPLTTVYVDAKAFVNHTLNVRLGDSSVWMRLLSRAFHRVDSDPIEVLTQAPSVLPVALKHVNDVLVSASLTNSLKPSTRLFEYQAKEVAWAVQTEIKGETGAELDVLSAMMPQLGLEDYTKEFPVLVDGLTGDMFDAKSVFEKIRQRHVSGLPRVTWKGGLLASEVGLGKTLTMISLCLHRRRKVPLATQDGALVRQARHHNGLWETEATLIVTPEHLSEQWKEEILKHTSLHPSRVLLIRNASMHEQVDVMSFVQADFVIVSERYLRSVSYVHLCGGSPTAPVGHSAQAKIDHMRPPFGIFHYRRIVFDESHEYLSRVARRVDTWSADHRWLMSATPFASPNGDWRFILRTLDIRINGKPLGRVHHHRDCPRGVNFTHDDLSTYNMNGSDGGAWWRNVLDHLIMRRHLFYRNTFDSVTGEDNRPSVKQHVLLVSLLDEEKLLLDACFNNELRLRVCTHPADVVANVAAVDDEEVVIPVGQEDLASVAMRFVPRARATLRNAFMSQEEILRIERAINRLSMEAPRMDRELRSVKQLLGSSSEASRRALLTDMSESGEAGIMRALRLRVGSKFATVARAVTQLLYPPDVEEGKPQGTDSADAVVEAESLDDDERTPKYTRKPKHARGEIKMTKTLPVPEKPARIIVFSRSDDSLRRYKEVFAQCGIQSLQIGPNPAAWVDRVVAFRKDVLLDPSGQEYPRVLLMNFRNWAGGCDFGMTTHMLLIDAVDGSAEQILAKEAQAIGRARRQRRDKSDDVTCLRFVCENTIEQELFELAHGGKTTD